MKNYIRTPKHKEKKSQVLQGIFGTLERNEAMKRLRNKGLSYTSIATLFKISKQRVHQIVSGYQAINNARGRNFEWWGSLCRAVFDRDDNQCQLCQSRDKLLIHHIDSDDRNNALDNLISLCFRCHCKLHLHKRGDAS